MYYIASAIHAFFISPSPMKLLFTLAMYLLLFISSLTAEAQGTVNVTIQEVVFNSNGSITHFSTPQPHCPGDLVWYNVYCDHYNNFKTRVYVTNGTVADYRPSGELINQNEVLILPPSAGSGNFGDSGGYDRAFVQVALTSASGPVGNLHAVVYYHYYGFLFTQQADGYYDQTLGLYSPNIQSPINACAGGSTPISIAPVNRATGYQWVSSTPAITINGAQTYNGSATNVNLSVASGLAPGTYSLQAYATDGPSSCPTSPAQTASVVVSNSGPGQASQEVFFNYNGSLCQPTYDVVIPAIAGATSYFAQASDGSGGNGEYEPSNNTVIFRLAIQGPQNAITVSFNVNNGCGSSNFTSAPTNLAGPDQSCGGGISYRTAQSSEPTAYPNPATDQLTLSKTDSDAQAVFYNESGIPRKTVQLLKQSEKTVVNTLDLPAGIYYLRILVGEKVKSQTQIVIQH